MDELCRGGILIISHLFKETTILYPMLEWSVVVGFEDKDA